MICIGSLKLRTLVLQSAMAGGTDLAFRLIARSHGLQLAYLEMISANALVYKAPKTAQLLKRSKEDLPLGVQIVGSDPATMGEAAVMLEDMGFDILDINCGCPVPKIISKPAGCALLNEPDRAKKIFNEVVKRVKKIPVTVKMRAGFSDPSGKEALVLAKLAEDAGVCAVTVHGRTGTQGYSGKADWGVVAKVKKSLGIPVFGNGDIHSGEDARRFMGESGCDGVMIGRAALG
ncbi:MAG: tRNA-dihydrouridine synthase family protein, partial [Chlamydiota bacterium]|nr:tRNA-dihydrouridine synthase family protein [Chlamydiota bacterium]